MFYRPNLFWIILRLLTRGLMSSSTNRRSVGMKPQFGHQLDSKISPKKQSRQPQLLPPVRLLLLKLSLWGYKWKLIKHLHNKLFKQQLKNQMRIQKIQEQKHRTKLLQVHSKSSRYPLGLWLLRYSCEISDWKSKLHKTILQAKNSKSFYSTTSYIHFNSLLTFLYFIHFFSRLLSMTEMTYFCGTDSNSNLKWTDLSRTVFEPVKYGWKLNRTVMMPKSFWYQFTWLGWKHV